MVKPGAFIVDFIRRVFVNNDGRIDAETVFFVACLLGSLILGTAYMYLFANNLGM